MRRRNPYIGAWPVNITVDPHITTNIVDVNQVAVALSGFAGTSIAANAANVHLH